MNIPEDVIRSVKHSYSQKGWENVEKPLAEQFLQPTLDNSAWIEKSLQMVNGLYRTRVSGKEIAKATEYIARMPTVKGSSDAAISQQIHKVASVFTKYRLSLASKFLHFCDPEFVPPFDKYAYTALYFSGVGRSCGLKWDKHPRSGAEIEMWLSSFRNFYNQHLSLCKQTRGEIIKSVIPIKDRVLAERAITPLKVCDIILWVWGGGGGSA